MKAYKKYKGNWKLIIRHSKVKMKEYDCKRRVHQLLSNNICKKDQADETINKTILKLYKKYGTQWKQYEKDINLLNAKQIRARYMKLRE